MFLRPFARLRQRLETLLSNVFGQADYAVHVLDNLVDVATADVLERLTSKANKSDLHGALKDVLSVMSDDKKTKNEDKNKNLHKQQTHDFLKAMKRFQT